MNPTDGLKALVTSEELIAHFNKKVAYYEGKIQEVVDAASTIIDPSRDVEMRHLSQRLVIFKFWATHVAPGDYLLAMEDLRPLEIFDTDEEADNRLKSLRANVQLEVLKNAKAVETASGTALERSARPKIISPHQ